MGYACPVCHAPQADGEHLANHLAFSALLGHDDHAEWLDDHAPGWNDQGPEELADRVTPHANEVEYETVFDDTTGQGPDVPDELLDAGGPDGPVEPAQLTPETRRVLDRARELTEQRRGGAEQRREETDEDESGK